VVFNQFWDENGDVAVRIFALHSQGIVHDRCCDEPKRRLEHDQVRHRKAALISISSTCAHAQSVEFKVPFDFTVSHQLLPAGIYSVRYTSVNLIMIQSKDGRLQAYSSAYTSGHLSTGPGKLVFRHYGDQYFLHQAL
jgi:hypothetical protein